MHTFTTDNKTISIFPCSESESPVIYLNTFLDEGQKVYEAAQAASCPPFTLVAISDLGWNHDMVPWDSPPAFKNADPCTGGADDYLRLLTEEIIPTAEKKIAGVPCWRGIAGYSLAGLFALYAMYRCDAFDRAAIISGSLWYPHFREFAAKHEMPRRPDRIYLSLGDKEKKTRHPLLKTVQDNTEAIAKHYRQLGIEVILERNPGNHFDDVDFRSAKGIVSL